MPESEVSVPRAGGSRYDRVDSTVLRLWVSGRRAFGDLPDQPLDKPKNGDAETSVLSSARATGGGMSDRPRFIVAEITKNWVAGEEVTGGTLAQKYEQILARMKRGGIGFIRGGCRQRCRCTRISLRRSLQCSR